MNASETNASIVNVSAVKTPMPEQPADVRRHNFGEVALGYDAGQAMLEARRCLQCKNPPCVGGCPVGVQIPRFIALLQKGDAAGAAAVIRETNALPAVCGRVCPQESQCEKLCVRGRKGEPVGIGRLERFAADAGDEGGADAGGSTGAGAGGSTGAGVPSDRPLRRVAVIGAGPAGLTCAGELARRGYRVTVFEALHTAGGVLAYGIPEFRLPKALVRREIARLSEMPVTFRVNAVVGRTFTLDGLFEDGFEAVFIGTGAGLPNFQGIAGESLCGVYSANEFLTRVNLMRAYDPAGADTPIRVGRRVAVVGGGNVAMDAARCALRLGADEVSIVYRRGAEEMPARAEEVHHAREEGVVFRLLENPVAYLGDENGFVTGARIQRMALGAPDASGRRRPEPVPDSEYTLPVDTVVVAIGNRPNPLLTRATPDLRTERWGGITATEDTGATSRPGVFAGGDAVTGAATVILAMGAGKRAAAAMDAYLREKDVSSGD